MMSQAAQNPDELFDVVDENDSIVGQATRAEVHAQKLLHRAVHVWLTDTSGQQLFIQKRSLFKDSSPGCWDSSCSGHVDAGETYELAARRELAEEIGVTQTLALALVLELKASPLTGYEFMKVFRGTYNGAFTLNPAEIDEGRWIPIVTLKEEMTRMPERFTRVFRHIAEQLLGH